MNTASRTTNKVMKAIVAEYTNLSTARYNRVWLRILNLCNSLAALKKKRTK